LDGHPAFFTIDLAALASRNSHVDMEKWLQDKIGESKDNSFPRLTLDFLAHKVSSEMSRQETNAPPTTVPLSVESMKTLLKVLEET
jgi:CCR4-NOT transcription complex subunit 1